MSDKKSKEPNSFDVLHELDRKLQKSKSIRESNQNKHKESKPSTSESRKRRSPSPVNYGYRDSKRSKKAIASASPPVEIDYDIPDRSLGDFYCKLCDAHMNSEMAWETHIQGKRHLKNLKRGDLDLKYDTLDEDPQIFSELKNVDEPIVGLSHCCEYQRLEGRPIYQCFLCSTNVPSGKALIEHLIGVKHMMAYLKEHDPKAHELIVTAELKKGMLEPVIIDYALNHRKKHGLGKMQVKKERLKPPKLMKTIWKEKVEFSTKAPSYYRPTYKDDFSHKKHRDDRRNEYSEREKDSNWRKIADYEDDYYRRRSITPPKSRYRKDYSASPSRNNDRYQDRESYLDREVSNMKSRSRPHSPQDNYGFTRTERLSPYDKVEKSLPTQDPVTYPRSSQSQCSNIRSEDLRLVLEQRKFKTTTTPETTHSDYIKKILDIICSLPSVVFLELVRVRVEQMETMNPSEAELTLLKNIGNMMISIVMNRKISTLSPEMLSKFVNVVKNKTSEPETTIKPGPEKNDKSSNLNDLMKLISAYKVTSSSSSDPFNTEQTRKSQHEPAFSTQMVSNTQNLWSQKPSTSSLTYEKEGIPGLTLSGSSSTYQLFGINGSSYPPSYPQKPQDPIGTKPTNNSWPTDQYKDYYGQY